MFDKDLKEEELPYIEDEQVSDEISALIGEDDESKIDKAAEKARKKAEKAEEKARKKAEKAKRKAELKSFEDNDAESDEKSKHSSHKDTHEDLHKDSREDLHKDSHNDSHEDLQEASNNDVDSELKEVPEKKKKKKPADYYDRESYLNMLSESYEEEERKKAAKKKKKAAEDTDDDDDIEDEWLTREEKREKKKAEKKKQKEENKVKPEDVNIVRDLLNLIIYIGIVIVFCFLVLTYVGQRTSVHGSSMNPTLTDGDNLWIDKIGYKFKEPNRFDVIVFPYKGDASGETFYIKRIIGLPGETVQIDKNGTIYIDGKVLDDSAYDFDQIKPELIGVASSPITLGSDEYFVLGDNRNESRDSRWADVGNIKKSDIIGRAAFRITPFKKFGAFDK